MITAKETLEISNNNIEKYNLLFSQKINKCIDGIKKRANDGHRDFEFYPDALNFKQYALFNNKMTSLGFDVENSGHGNVIISW